MWYKSQLFNSSVAAQEQTQMICKWMSMAMSQNTFIYGHKFEFLIIFMWHRLFFFQFFFRLFKNIKTCWKIPGESLIYICICLCTYIYTLIYIYTHVHTDIYIHIHTPFIVHGLFKNKHRPDLAMGHSLPNPWSSQSLNSLGAYPCITLYRDKEWIILQL